MRIMQLCNVEEKDTKKKRTKLAQPWSTTKQTPYDTALHPKLRILCQPQVLFTKNFLRYH
jgi:hypothetical protein